MTKTELRKYMLEKRRQRSLETVQRDSKKMVSKIRKHPEYIKANTVALFHPFNNELDVLPLLIDSLKTFCFPKVVENDIVFYKVNHQTVWKKSAFGVLEPENGEIIDHIDFMIVPALAIGKDFNRIGYGKGFYDRFLEKNRPKKAVGIICSFQEVDSIPSNEHDQKLDEYIKV